jgi:hypothetical protein
VFTTDQGLGVLAKSFHDHGVVTDVMTVAHGRRPEHPEWYPGAPRLTDLRAPSQRSAARAFCRSVDAMLFFETPFMWDLFPFCREHGVRTYLMPMHECMPTQLPERPDVMLCPSPLDLRLYVADYLRPQAEKGPLPFLPWDGSIPGTPAYLTPVPVDTDRIKWRRRETAEVFVHNAGHGGLKGRNGTHELVTALRYVKSPVKLILRAQDRPCGELLTYSTILHIGKVTVDYRYGTCPADELYSEGDVFLFPEKFNGLSLPLQEARAAGMLVMCGDRFPMNAWLPRRWSPPPPVGDNDWADLEPEWEPLIPVRSYRKGRVSPRCNEYDEAVFDPRDVAAKIDEWYGRDVSAYSNSGLEWARSMSWEVLGPKYKEVLGG